MTPHVRTLRNLLCFLLLGLDDKDRESFLDPVGGILLQSSTPCYAWSLLGNHAHFLLRTGQIPISRVMRKLLTGYAVTFRRYHRHGHLFQNRYKSILCEEDAFPPTGGETLRKAKEEGQNDELRYMH